MADTEKEIIRVLRLVEYEGPRAEVEAQVAGSLHGTRFYRRGGEQIRITGMTLGIYPEVIEEARRIIEPLERSK